MMLSAIISFFGGSAFRMIWGEISAFLTRKQDFQHELQMVEVQARIAAEQHARNLEAIKVQADLGVQTIRVAAEGEVDKIGADAWRIAVQATATQTGIWLVDLWNGLIRPGLATIATVGWIGHFSGVWVLDENSWNLVGAVLGIYIADRTLFKRGK